MAYLKPLFFVIIHQFYYFATQFVISVRELTENFMVIHGRACEMPTAQNKILQLEKLRLLVCYLQN